VQFLFLEKNSRLIAAALNWKTLRWWHSLSRFSDWQPTLLFHQLLRDVTQHSVTALVVGEFGAQLRDDVITFSIVLQMQISAS
jgi:hypothetical protein